MNYQAFAITLSIISIVLVFIGVLPINTATMLFVLPIVSSALMSSSEKKRYKKNVAKHRMREEE